MPGIALAMLSTDTLPIETGLGRVLRRPVGPAWVETSHRILPFCTGSWSTEIVALAQTTYTAFVVFEAAGHVPADGEDHVVPGCRRDRQAVDANRVRGVAKNVSLAGVGCSSRRCPFPGMPRWTTAAQVPEGT